MKADRQSFARAIVALMLISAPLLLWNSCNDEREEPFDYTTPSLSTSPQQLGDWFEQLTAISKLTGTSAPELSRIYAYASIAFYEGYVNSDPTMRTLEGQLAGLENLPRPTSDAVFNHGVVAEAAMAEVLSHAFQGAGSFTLNVIRSTYQNHENRYRDLGVQPPIIERSKTLGKELGQVIIAWMDADGIDEVLNCDWPGFTGQNSWQPTPPSNAAAQLPCWGQLRPFTFPKGQTGQICASFFPAPVTNDFGSPYMAQVNEMLVVADELSASQKEVAVHWNDGQGSFTPPGHYMALFRQLIAQHSLNGRQTATMFAQLCIAMADVYIVGYHDKYQWGRPRPVTFIRTLGFDSWNSFNQNPATPEYPCIRAGLGYAAGQVFTNIYGNLAFTDDSQYLFGLPPRSFESFNAMSDEVAMAQFLGGTNYRATVLAAEYGARCIAQRSNELFLNQ